MTRKVKKTIFAVIIILIAGIILFPVIRRNLFSGSGDSELAQLSAPKPAQNTLAVNARILAYKPLSQEFRSYGRFLPDEEVELSFETSGMITEIIFKEGTFVKKGQILARVNDKPLQAELRKLEAQVPLARARLSRQSALLDKDAVSQESYESVATELETLLADIDLVKARIDQTELRAPFEGMLGLRQVSEGAYATPTTVVTTLTKINPLKLQFNVNENQLQDIKVGTEIEFRLSNDSRSYPATVYAVESRLDRGTLNLTARALYNNTEGRVVPGQFASLNIVFHEYGKSIVVPSMSIVTEMGRDIVYVYRNGKATQVPISKGMRTESEVQAMEGLIPGDTLITTGVMQLRDGLSVNIVTLEEDRE